MQFSGYGELIQKSGEFKNYGLRFHQKCKIWRKNQTTKRKMTTLEIAHTFLLSFDMSLSMYKT